MKNKEMLTNFSMGVCYYPEHWDKTLWRSDLERMHEIGISVIRIAEFAWNKFEPLEGIFDFTFFDEFMDLAEEMGMKVIFCTPTATPPAWMQEQYPEILNRKLDGTKVRHGERRNYNYNSPTYLYFTKRIVSEIARHYGKRKSIVGWQIDNEFNCGAAEFYSEADTLAFRRFLKDKYGTLEVLNRAWGTVFWNQDYTQWDQVYVPQTTNRGVLNPNRMQDYYWFVSNSVIEYAKLQRDVLKKYIRPEQMITHNGMYNNIDNHELTTEVLDFYCYDSYPAFAYSYQQREENSGLKDRNWSKKLAIVRSMGEHFGIMEQQAGGGSWIKTVLVAAPQPGQLALWSLQSMAHGANYISYFRWRTCTFGQEIYWHGILNYDNRDNRRIDEVREVFHKMQLANETADTKYVAEFAVLADYDNIFDTQIDDWHHLVNGVSEQGWFEAGQLTHTPMNYLYFRKDTGIDDLAKYKVLIYPHASIMTSERSDLLKEYVRQGGKLVIGCRSGYKNENGHCSMMSMPGYLAELCGCEVEDFTVIPPQEDKVTITWDGKTINAPISNDILHISSENAETLATYDSGYYADKPALVCNRYGNGYAYYFGAAFDVGCASYFLEKLGISAPLDHVVEMPECCELAVRENQNRRYIYILNYAAKETEIVLNQKVYDLFSEKGIDAQKVNLKPYEVKLYRLYKGLS